MKNTLVKALATGFGLGLIPVAPGTFGTLLAIPFFWALHHAGTFPYMFITVIFAFFSCLIAELAGPLFPTPDSPHIVIDEVAGFLVTMVWLPRTWQAVALGFILFRILDITKPGPIGYLDRKIKGGVGVVVDDIAAGIAANVMLQVIYTNTTWLGTQLT